MCPLLSRLDMCRYTYCFSAIRMPMRVCVVSSVSHTHYTTNCDGRVSTHMSYVSTVNSQRAACVRARVCAVGVPTNNCYVFAMPRKTKSMSTSDGLNGRHSTNTHTRKSITTAHTHTHTFCGPKHVFNLMQHISGENASRSVLFVALRGNG